MKTSEAVGSIIHAFSDKERRDSVRQLAGKVAMMETVLGDVVAKGACDCDEDEHDVPCTWCCAKAALE